MSLREKLEKRIFERELAAARKRFRKVADKADRLRLPKKEKRTMFKLMLQAAGYKKIRLLERD